MASLTRTYSHEKLRGKIYTPDFVVEKILDDVGFKGEYIVGKSIIDPACGDGQFLVAIVQRLIHYAPTPALRDALAHIHGWDIDAEAVAACIAQLNASIAPLELGEIEWNIHVCDALRQPHTAAFDFVVGNPPYIRIQHLDEETRTHIRQQYRFCGSGSTDIYIAFYELAHRLLAPDGVCGFITPNTFFYTATAFALRDFLVSEKLIQQITNYGDVQVFDNATTYSAILVFGKQPQQAFRYQQATAQQAFAEREISLEELQHRPFWQLSPEAAAPQMGGKLGDICQIHVGLTTLCDKGYIFSIEIIDETYALAHTRLQGDVLLERAILRPIVKGSLLKSSEEEISSYILFPYEKHHGKHRIIAEESLKTAFPKAYGYLLSIKDELDKRDNGKPNRAAWYAFGRSQGLDTTFGKKIIFSPMNNRPNFVLYEREDATLYSGYCIKYEGDYAWLLRELNSQRLADFIAVSSRDFRGGWKAYNKKTLAEFPLQQIPPPYIQI